jgi:hypothetical protein
LDRHPKIRGTRLEADMRNAVANALYVVLIVLRTLLAVALSLVWFGLGLLWLWVCWHAAYRRWDVMHERAIEVFPIALVLGLLGFLVLAWLGEVVASFFDYVTLNRGRRRRETSQPTLR